MVTQESFGAGEKRQSLPLNWLTKLIESFALYISLAGLIGHSRPSPAKVVLIALICLGFVLTAFWEYIQARERYLLNDLETQLKEVAPEYRETVMRRERVKWPISSTALLAYGVPALVALIWIVLFIFAAST